MIQFYSEETDYKIQAETVVDLLNKLVEDGCELEILDIKNIVDTAFEAEENGSAEYFDFSEPESKFEIKIV